MPNTGSHVNLGDGRIRAFGVRLHSSPASAQTVPPKRDLASAAALPEIVFVQTPQLVSGPLAKRFPLGSKIVRFHPSATQHLTHLTEGLFAAADP
jgi:hypothetical protein